MKMKKLLAILALLIVVPVYDLGAQVYIDMDMLRGSIYPLKLEVLDSLTKEPIPFASVYLNHPGDTVITHFTLSDTNGKAELKDVPSGEHRLSVEYMGYLPYRKKIYMRGEKDFGKVLLKQDTNLLEAAKVSAVGNPVEFLRDTIVFNASSFYSNDSDVLKDLLKKMPTVVIDSEGNVKVNGKDVNKITVNGKTFFLGDKSAALNNIPAKAVDKVKVIDKESDAAAFSGIKDDSKETVMDVELKQEYKKGVFGNVRLGLGTSIPDKSQNEFIEKVPFLWNSNGMLSAFGEKDQVTLIGSGMNAPGSDGVEIYTENSNLGQGISTSAQTGINYNTDRIKALDANATVYWRFNDVNGKERSLTQTYQELTDDIFSFKDGVSHNDRHYLHAGIELENRDKQKFNFIFKPDISVSSTRRNSSDSTSSSVGDVQKNFSVGTDLSFLKALTTKGEFTFGIKDLGKQMRSLTLVGDYRIDMDKGNETEVHRTWYGNEGITEMRSLNYDKASGDKSLYLSLQYVEPINENWAIQAVTAGNLNEDHSSKDAFNLDGSANINYTAWSRSYYTSALARLLMQYNKDSRNIRFGALTRASQSLTRALSMGNETETSSGLLWNWAPFLVYKDRFKNGSVLYARYDGESYKPDHSGMLPVLNISNPTYLTLGNINLKPSFSHSFDVSIRRFQPEKMRNIYTGLNGSLTMRPQVNAIWFDSNSIRYSIPVNSSHPSIYLMGSVFYSSKIGKSGKLGYHINGMLRYSRNISYQAGETIAPIDLGDFNYNSFMDTFWGMNGNNFYKGISGFRESRSQGAYGYLSLGLNWRGESLTIQTELYGNLKGNWYSLDTTADNVSEELGGRVMLDWRLPKDYSIRFAVQHLRYFGYAAGFNRPRTPTMFAIYKSLKAWTFSLNVNDIFNNGIYNIHSVGDNYISDRYFNALGRYVVFSVSYRFGKMNPSRSEAAQDAMWKML